MFAGQEDFRCCNFLQVPTQRGVVLSEVRAGHSKVLSDGSTWLSLYHEINGMAVLDCVTGTLVWIWACRD